MDCDRRCFCRQCSFDPTREIRPNVKIWAHRPESWECDRVEGRQLGLLTNSATVSFAYKYDPWGVQTLTAGGTGNGAAQNPFAFHAGI